MTGSEEWRPVLGWEGIYRVSDLGRALSVRSGQLLTLTVAGNGYFVVTLSWKGVDVKRTIHSMVAEAFIGIRPDGTEVRHKNGTRLDCRAENIHYGTSTENSQDSIRHGTFSPPPDHNSSKEACPLDHLLVEPNLRNSARLTGKRGCRACHQAGTVVSYWAAKGVVLNFEVVANEKYLALRGKVAMC